MLIPQVVQLRSVCRQITDLGLSSEYVSGETSFARFQNVKLKTYYTDDNKTSLGLILIAE